MSMFRLFVLLWLCLLQSARPEIIPLSMVLEARSDVIQYYPLWLEAPAKIGLKGVSFVTASSSDDLDDAWVGDDRSGGDDMFPQNNSMAPQITPAPRPASTVAPQAEPTAAPQGLTVAPVASPTGAPSEPQDLPTVASEGPTVAPNSSPVAPQEVPAEAPQVAPTNPTTQMPTAAPVATPDADSGGTPSEVPSPSPVGRRDQMRALDGGAGKGAQKTYQIIDILIFQVPDDCKRNRWGGCDWSVLGVGMRDEWMPGGVEFCCSAEAVSNGSCTSDELGRILLDRNSFTGRHVSIDVPSEPNMLFSFDYQDYPVETTGDYIIIFANCFSDGMDVFVEGYMTTETEKGYKLPGELHDLMYFYVFMTVIFFLVILWYYCGMRMFQEASIPIQRFILATLILGLIEFFFRALDLGLWNIDGTRSETVIWIAVVVGVLKRGITRSLFVMVAMGWGVVRDSLGYAYLKIIFLGLLYCAMTMLRDFFAVLALDKLESWSAGAEQELLDLAFLATLAVVAINLIFFFWIITALSNTTEYLKNMNQTTKLRRHLRLRCIIITAFVIAMVWFVFSVVDGALKVLTTNQYWFMEGVMHLNNLFVILSVAILWRPNANSKDYAMQMQLATGDDDVENELELSCVIPSAEDLDEGGNDPDHPNGLRVHDAEVS